MCTAGPNVFAHTGVQQAAEAGTTSYNAFTITHGCGAGHEDPTELKVRGQSAVFPFGVAVWTDVSTGEIIPTGGQGIVSEDDDFITLHVEGIQDNDPFAKQEAETDDLGNVRALNWKHGALATNLIGTPRWRATAPVILDNCVSTLMVRIAVANWCEKNKNEKNDKDNNRADWWFTGPDKTGSTLFVDPDLVQEDFWTTLTANLPVSQILGLSGGKWRRTGGFSECFAFRWKSPLVKSRPSERYLILWPGQ